MRWENVMLGERGRRGREGGYEVCGEWGALGAVGLERETGDRGK